MNTNESVYKLKIKNEINVKYEISNSSFLVFLNSPFLENEWRNFFKDKNRGVGKFFRDDSKGDIIFNWAETARTLLTGAS